MTDSKQTPAAAPASECRMSRGHTNMESAPAYQSPGVGAATAPDPRRAWRSRRATTNKMLAELLGRAQGKRAQKEDP